MTMQISVESIWNELGGHVHCDLPVDIPPFHLRGVEMVVAEGSTVAFDVYHTEEGWFLTGQGDVALTARCSRCLGEAEVVVPVSFSVEIPDTGDRRDDQKSVDEDEVIPRITRQGDLDVQERVLEEIILSIPLRILCDPDCKGLCPVCGVNLNETTCECERDPVDPRLAALQKLKETLKE